MPTPTTLTPAATAAPSGSRVAIGVLAVVALAVLAAMLLSLLTPSQAAFDDGPVPPPPVVPEQPAPTVPDAAGVFSGKEDLWLPTPPSF